MSKDDTHAYVFMAPMWITVRSREGADKARELVTKSFNRLTDELKECSVGDIQMTDQFFVRKRAYDYKPPALRRTGT